MSKLKLEVILAAIDRVTAPLKGISSASKAVSSEVKVLREKLKELNGTQLKIDGFNKLREQAKKSTEQMRELKDSIKVNELRVKQSRTLQAQLADEVKGTRRSYKRLSEEIKKTPEPSNAQLRSLALLTAELEKVELKYQRAQYATRRHSAALHADEQALTRNRGQRQNLSRSLSESRQRLQDTGISTRQLAQAEAELRTRTEATNRTLAQQRQRLEQLGHQQQRLSAARATYDRQIQTRDKIAGAGAAAMGVGTAVGLPIMQTINEAKHFNTEMQRIAGLGFSKETNADAEAYARAMKTYGTSATENATLVRDAMTVFADLHHAEMVAPELAKMKFANTAIFGAADGAKNEEQFINMLKVIELRGGTKNKEAFMGEANRIQQVIAATGGRVGPEEWKNFIQTSGVAGKQLSSRSFYNMMEPLIQEMGGHQVGTGLMSAYSNIYQGKTTVRAAREMGRLGLIDPKNVEYDKVGQLKRIKPGALKDGETFKANPLEWLENTLLPALKAKGITDQGAINDTISSIFTNRTAANLMTTMVLQRQQIHKSAKLSEGSATIDQLNALAKISTAGKEVAAHKGYEDLKLAVGENVLPLYNSLLEKILAITQATKAWMNEHPQLARALIIGAAALAVFLLVMGAVTLALAAILGPMAMVRLSMSTLGIGLTGPIGLISKFSGGIATLGRSLMPLLFTSIIRISAMLAPLSGMFATLGAVIMATPIGWIIGGIAALIGVGVLLYKYWAPIKAFFTGFFGGLISAALPAIKALWQACTHYWGSLAKLLSGIPILGPIFSVMGSIASGALSLISTAAQGLWGWIKALLQPVNDTGNAAQNMGIRFGTAIGNIVAQLLSLPTQFVTIGGQMIDGLISGITSKMGALKETITSVGSGATNWVKEKLGIHSPSRVFAELGGFTMEGFNQGLGKGQNAPLATLDGMAQSLIEQAKRINLPLPNLPSVSDALNGMRSFTGQLAATSGLTLGATLPALANVPMDTRPPISASARPAAAPVALAPITIQIYQQPGQDSKQIAQMVAAEIEKIQRANAAKGRSRLSDKD
ncbi:hypothetical protein [Iodobacter sp.]|uniref:hypothetical protein n=1 Tax=Iodobacter sp. TaxID=1915058 RepID=UPI0025F78064|nr:hypothetical protein [Iodobacter sp.]